MSEGASVYNLDGFQGFGGKQWLKESNGSKETMAQRKQWPTPQVPVIEVEEMGTRLAYDDGVLRPVQPQPNLLVDKHGSFHCMLRSNRGRDAGRDTRRAIGPWSH